MLVQVVLILFNGATLACLIWLKLELIAHKLMISTISVQSTIALFQFAGVALQMGEIVATVSERRELRQSSC